MSLKCENLNDLDFEGQFVQLLGIKCKFVGGPNSESRFSSFWQKRSSYLFKTLLMECNVKQPLNWFLGPVLLYTHFQTNKTYLAHNRNTEFERQGYSVSPWKNTNVLYSQYLYLEAFYLQRILMTTRQLCALLFFAWRNSNWSFSSTATE